MEIVTNLSKVAPPGRPVGVYGVLSGRIHPHRLLSPILVLGFYVISTNFNDETASRLFLQVNTLGGVQAWDRGWISPQILVVQASHARHRNV